MMLADKITAEEAERWGMIYKYFDDESFAEESLKLAKKLAQMPTKALALTKQALKWSATHSLSEQLQNEDTLQQKAAQTKDFKEGLNAFLQKRPPDFKGE